MYFQSREWVIKLNKFLSDDFLPNFEIEGPTNGCWNRKLFFKIWSLKKFYSNDFLPKIKFEGVMLYIKF